MSVKAEHETQAVKVRALLAYLKARPGQWVPAPELAAAIGSLAVSTKISQARELAGNDAIEWNHDARNSCYMLRPARLGRDAATEIPAPWNQDRPFAPPFELKP